MVAVVRFARRNAVDLEVGTFDSSRLCQMLWLFNEPDVFNNHRVFDSVFVQARPLPQLRKDCVLASSPDAVRSTGEFVLSTDAASASTGLPIATKRRRK